MTHVAPIVIPKKNKSNRALNIDLLFIHGKGTPSVCKYCKSVLCLVLHHVRHLISFYREAHDANPENFPVGFNGAMSQLLEPLGYKSTSRTFTWNFTSSYAESIIEKMPSDEAPAHPTTQESFNKEMLQCYIHNFVVADDQVSFKSIQNSLV